MKKKKPHHVKRHPFRNLRASFALLFMVMFTMNAALLTGCASAEKEQTGPVYKSVPAPFRKSGMISSTTYQVYVETKADSEEKARINGEALARTTAFKLISNESFARIRISPYGRKKIKNLIENHGKIVRISQYEKNQWGISYQIYRQDLREYLKSIR